MGEFFVSYFEPDKFKGTFKNNSVSNYQVYQEEYKENPVDESYATPEIFEEAMFFYIKYFIKLIKEVLAEGYDWDVITSMTRTDFTEDRYRKLVAAICKEEGNEG